jgi:hypothetical protein
MNGNQVVDELTLTELVPRQYSGTGQLKRSDSLIVAMWFSAIHSKTSFLTMNRGKKSL